MAKKNKIKWKTGVCQVEKFTDGNTKKKKIFYCSTCSVWMCKKCSSNIVKRIMAVVNKNLNKKVKL